VVNATPRSLYAVRIVEEAGWAPGPVWTGIESLGPNGIRSPDHPTGSESLYRLRCPDPQEVQYVSINARDPDERTEYFKLYLGPFVLY